MLLQHYKPKPLIIADCFAFHKWDQRPEEKVNEFLTELRKLAWSCDFGDFLEQALRDKFVCGLANLNLQKRLLTEKNLTLEQAVSIATAMEMAALESRESKKTAGASSYMQVEEINHIKSQRYAGCCYCCEKKGIWHHCAASVLTNTTNVVRQAIYKQFVQKIRIHKERSRNVKNNVARGALMISNNFKQQSSRGKSQLGNNWWTQGRL